MMIFAAFRVNIEHQIHLQQVNAAEHILSESNILVAIRQVLKICVNVNRNGCID